MALLALIHSVAINATVLKDFKEKIVIKVIISKYFPFLFSEVEVHLKDQIRSYLVRYL